MYGELFAFGNGLMASISPCTFPIYPIIFAYFFLEKGILDKKKISMFVGGYALSMVLLSVILLNLSGIAMVTEVLRFAGAGFMIIFGAFLIVKKGFNFHMGTERIKNPFIFGMVFAFMINPCSFPFLLSTLSFSMTSASGYLFVLLYGLGLIIPPTLFAIMGKSVLRKVEKIYPKWWLINTLTGIILIIAGIFTAYTASVTRYSLVISSTLLLALVLAIIYFGFMTMSGRKKKYIKIFQMGVIGAFWAVFTFRCSQFFSDKMMGASCSMSCEICSTCIFLLSLIAVTAIISIYLMERYIPE